MLRRSDVVFVNSVRDGMNLVVLEGLVLSERDPAVVLSREMGAAEVLGDDAIAVNPFDVVGDAPTRCTRRCCSTRDERAAGPSGCARRPSRLPPADVVPGAARRAARSSRRE